MNTTHKRPWKQHSRTIIIEYYFGDLIDIEGWSEFNRTFTLDTSYYAKYANRGSGVSKKGRVKWSGCYVLTSTAEVQNFTVEILFMERVESTIGGFTHLWHD